jgi:hypothetical protein
MLSTCLLLSLPSSSGGNCGFSRMILTLAMALVGMLTLDHESSDAPLFPEWVLWTLVPSLHAAVHRWGGTCHFLLSFTSCLAAVMTTGSVGRFIIAEVSGDDVFCMLLGPTDS